MSAEWSVVRLGSYCLKVGSGATPKGGKSVYLESGGIALIRSQNIYNDGFKASGLAYIAPQAAEKLSNVEVQPNDVLLNITGDSVARVCLAPDEHLPARVNQHVAIIRPDPKEFDARFLRYFLTSPVQQELLLSIASAGATRNALTKSHIESLEVCKPELQTQRRIADKLHALEKKIQLNQKINQTLEQIAQALFKSWFIDFEPVKAKIAARERWQALGPENESASPVCYAAEFNEPPTVGDLETTMNRAAMQAISGKTAAQLDALRGEDPERYNELYETATLFPSAMQDSELGEIPEGWKYRQIGDLVSRQSVGKKYSQKTVSKKGSVPVLDQGKIGVIGYHNDKPGIAASPQAPVVVFANHTCNMRLIMHDFSVIQNVLPFTGHSVDIYWLFFATLGKQSFVEYKGHWPDFVVKEIVVPSNILTFRFGESVANLIFSEFQNSQQNKALSELRDTLLPKLLFGELTPAKANR